MELLVGVLASLIVGVLVNEAYAWFPRLSEILLRSAVRRLPNEMQLRYEEEWREFLDATPHGVTRIVQAFGLTLAAMHIAFDSRKLSIKTEHFVVVGFLLRLLPRAVLYLAVHPTMVLSTYGVFARAALSWRMPDLDEIRATKGWEEYLNHMMQAPGFEAARKAGVALRQEKKDHH